ncbi:MAG TPA: ATP-binding protein [Candidatus Wirthbacteria bacterium]|mgnify:CR=1 FL=1|nr:ATP-binding protein [Candidatus Wirthbacteria bacterium]
MINRNLFSTVSTYLDQFPAVGLVGARQVGKTTLAKQIIESYQGAIYLDMELPSDLAKLRDPELYLSHHQDRLIVLDEIQRLPGLFTVLRSLIDQNNRPGRFLILGSASPELLRQSSESLAGRIGYLELPPLSLPEITSQTDLDWQTLWTRGGFAPSLLADSTSKSLRWRLAYLTAYIDRDLPGFGVTNPPAQILRLLTMLAHGHGQLVNFSKLSTSLGISLPTLKRYLDILKATYLLREICPYHANLKKRLVKSPKLYLQDSGMLHALLNLLNYDQLLGHPISGASWEGFVIEQVIRQLPEFWEFYFFRTHTGAEIDLLLLPPGQKPVALEIKHSLAPRLPRGFVQAYSDLNCQRGFVIYPGQETYPLDVSTHALPISRLADIWG